MNMGPDNPNQVHSASAGAYIHPNQPRLVYLIYRGLRKVSIQASNLKSELKKKNTIVHGLQLHSPGITGVSDIVAGPKSLHYEPSPRIATSLLDPTSDSHRTPNPNSLTTFNNPTKAQFIPKEILTKAATATPLKTNRERKRERERDRETALQQYPARPAEMSRQQRQQPPRATHLSAQGLGQIRMLCRCYGDLGLTV